MEELILAIDILIDGAMEVKGKTGEASMITFHGKVDCPLFKGVVIPGGVDTQKEKYGEPRLMSARYLLEGTDDQGKPCKIFIENNGNTRDENGIMQTVPTIYTDSESLSWLETTPLRGTVNPQEGGVQIRFFGAVR